MDGVQEQRLGRRGGEGNVMAALSGVAHVSLLRRCLCAADRLNGRVGGQIGLKSADLKMCT